MARNYKPGEFLSSDGHIYKAVMPLKRGDCKGCDFKFHNGQFNECHAPDGTGCIDVIFKKATNSLNHKVPYGAKEVDVKGCRNALIIISTAAGALMAALATAIYYLFQ